MSTTMQFMFASDWDAVERGADTVDNSNYIITAELKAIFEYDDYADLWTVRTKGSCPNNIPVIDRDPASSGMMTFSRDVDLLIWMTNRGCVLVRQD